MGLAPGCCPLPGMCQDDIIDGGHYTGGCEWSHTLKDDKNFIAMRDWARTELNFTGNTLGELAEVLKTSGICPVSSADWWRLKAQVQNKGAPWHCMGCIGRWEHNSQPSAPLWGSLITNDQENRFNFLKAGVLTSCATGM